MNTLETGDLLKFAGALGMPSLYHYGVYLGSPFYGVVHMWASLNRPKADAKVELISVHDFYSLASRRGVSVIVEKPAIKLPEPQIHLNALQVIGNGGYHALHNNCEHIAFYCATGNRMSKQVDAVFPKRG